MIDKKIIKFNEICERLFKSYSPKVNKDEARAGVLGHHPLAMLVIAQDIIRELQEGKE